MGDYNMNEIKKEWDTKAKGFDGMTHNKIQAMQYTLTNEGTNQFYTSNYNQGIQG